MDNLFNAFSRMSPKHLTEAARVSVSPLHFRAIVQNNGGAAANPLERVLVQLWAYKKPGKPSCQSDALAQEARQLSCVLA
jgi:hypothetical protein